MRSQRIKLAIVLGLLLLAPVTLASAYSYYGGDGTTYVIALQWTTVGDVVQGQLSEVYVISADPYRLKGFSQAFTGTQDGADVSFIMAKPSIFNSGTTWTGTVQHNGLILTIPASSGTLSTLNLAAGSTQDYERAVTRLQGIVAAAAKRHDQQLAVADANHNLEVAIAQLRTSTTGLPHDIDLLQRDVADLKTKVKSMRHDYRQTMQGHYDKLVQDTSVKPLSCQALHVTISYDLNSTLEYDLNSTLAYDLNSSIAYDVNTTLPFDVTKYGQQVDAAMKAIYQIGTGFQRLQAAVAANESGTPAPEYDAATLNNVISIANRQVASADQQVQSLQEEAKGFETAAKQVYQDGKALFAQAQALVATLTCLPE